MYPADAEWAGERKPAEPEGRGRGGGGGDMNPPVLPCPLGAGEMYPGPGEYPLLGWGDGGWNPF